MGYHLHFSQMGKTSEPFFKRKWHKKIGRTPQ